MTVNNKKFPTRWEPTGYVFEDPPKKDLSGQRFILATFIGFFVGLFLAIVADPAAFLLGWVISTGVVYAALSS